MLNDHKQKPKRLEPSPKTLKSLYLKSGNQCAFPGCQQAMQLGDTKFGQVCHIEDALPGCRWNAARTNEENRREENLILLCYNHHKTTDNTEYFQVEDLNMMKTDHEHCISKGITPTVVNIGGDGDVMMFGAKITGGAQVTVDGKGKKKLVGLDIDGGKNRDLTEKDFLPPSDDK